MCAHFVYGSHLVRQWWTCPLCQWFSPGKTVVDVPTLSMVLTWHLVVPTLSMLLTWHLTVPTLSILLTWHLVVPTLSMLFTWHLTVPTLSMLLTWQDSGGRAQFVNGSLQQPVSSSQSLQELGLFFIYDLFHLKLFREKRQCTLVDVLFKYSSLGIGSTRGNIQ